MKAILVIDVPDNTEFDKDYRLTGLLLANEYAENVGIEFKDARLKPVPERKKVIPIVTHNRENAKLEIANQNKGFNDCIDELLGEDNESNISN